MGVRISPAQDAQDVRSARREILKADDFRVRLAAALIIGRTKPPDGLQLLEKALSDPHPAVRAAAAAALGSYGDPAAVPALQQHLETEGTQSVRAQLERSIASLRGGGSGGPHASQAGTKYIVQLGSMRNLSGVRGSELGQVLRSAARDRAASVAGAVVAADPQAAAKRGIEEHVPVLVLDGTVVRMAQQPQGNGPPFRQTRFAFGQPITFHDQVRDAGKLGACIASHAHLE